MQGNELYRYEFKLKNGREISLVPDNHFYLLTYCYLEKSNNGRTYVKDYEESGTDFKYLALGSGLIKTVVFSVGDPFKEEDKYSRIICGEKLTAKLSGVTGIDYPSGTFMKGRGKGEPFKSWSEFIKAEGYNFGAAVHAYGNPRGYEYKGLKEFYEYHKKYIDNVTDEIRKLGYDKMINKFEEGEYYYYGTPLNFGSSNETKILPGLVRIKFESEKGKRVKMIVQNSFDDGKFYDKEKFFVSFRLGFRTDSYSIIAFDDMLFAGYSYDGGFMISGVFSKRSYDYAAFNLTEKGLFWALGITSERYFCLTELESKYNAEKDPISTVTIQKRIFKAYSGK